VTRGLAGPVSPRQHLAELRERKRDARDRINEAKSERDEARARLPDGAPDLSDERWRAAEMAVHRLQRAEEDLALVREQENYALSQVAGVSSSGGDFSGSFLDDPAALKQIASFAHSRTPIGTMPLGELQSPEQMVAELNERRRMAAAGNPVVDMAGATRAPFYGIVPQQRRRLSVLDLLPSSVMELPRVPYLREAGSLDAAAEKSELAVAAPGDIELTEQEAVAKTIASWAKMSREALADVAGLQTTITERLSYSLERRLEFQLLNGDGLGENITGLFNTSGVPEVTYESPKSVADMALAGLRASMLIEAEPTGICIHPTDWATILEAKASTSGVYLGGGPFTPTDRQLWTLPTVVSVAVPKGKILVGDFARGAVVLIREGALVRLSDSDQDDFVRGRVTAFAELRAGLMVLAARRFVVVHLE
jgi:Phage capsid family